MARHRAVRFDPCGAVWLITYSSGGDPPGWFGVWTKRLGTALGHDSADVSASIALLARLESSLVAKRHRAAGPHD